MFDTIRKVKLKGIRVGPGYHDRTLVVRRKTPDNQLPFKKKIIAFYIPAVVEKQ